MATTVTETKGLSALSEVQEYVEERGSHVATRNGVPDSEVGKLVRKMVKFVEGMDDGNLNMINTQGQWLVLKKRVERKFEENQAKTMFELIEGYWFTKADEWPMLDKSLSDPLGMIGVNGDQKNVAYLVHLCIYREDPRREALARAAANWVKQSDEGDRSNRVSIPFLVAEFVKLEARVLGGQITRAEAYSELERAMESAEVLRACESRLMPSERSLVYRALYTVGSLMHSKYPSYFAKIVPERKRRWESPERSRKKRGSPVEVSPTDLDWLIERKNLVKRTVCVERLVDNGPRSPRRVQVHETLYLEANSAALADLDALIDRYRLPIYDEPESPVSPVSPVSSPAYRP